MAAQNLEELFDFETNFELAAQSFIEQELDIPVSMIYRTLEDDDFEFPRIHVQFEVGEALDPPGERFDGVAPLAYVKYGATMTLRIVSDATQVNSELAHRSNRAKLRAAMEIGASNFTTTINGEPILPYYEVNYLRPTGSTTEAEGDAIESTLTYQIFFSIKADAWPEEEEETPPEEGGGEP